MRHSEHKRMEKSKPTHTLRELCKHPETADVLKEKPTGKEIREFLRNTSWNRQKHSPQAEEKSEGSELW